MMNWAKVTKMEICDSLQLSHQDHFYTDTKITFLAFNTSYVFTESAVTTLTLFKFLEDKYTLSFLLSCYLNEEKEGLVSLS